MVTAVAIWSVDAVALTFTRHPWLSLPTTTSILVAWQTDLESSSLVLYGPDPVDDWSAASQASGAGDVLDHAVPLEGLAPGTQYRYRVVSDTDTLDAGSFRTAPDGWEPFRFVVFGDLGTATAAQRQIASRVDTLDADLAILTGDIVYVNGEPWNFTPYYFDIYRSTLKRIPFYPVLGNHDTYYDNGASFVNEFHLPANFAAGPERSYSFEYGSAHFAAIEVTVENTAPSAAAMAWLDADLAATTKLWKFVFFHVPMYSNEGSHGGDAAIAAALEPILTSRNVDMVFQGHNHFYTRTYPIRSGLAVDQTWEPAYFNPSGPIYVVAGGGGRSLHGLTVPSPREVLSRSIYHLVSVDVCGDVLTLRAIEEDGTIFDTMTLRKGTPTYAPGEETSESAPLRFTLGHPRPNPSSGSVGIRFTLPAAGRAAIRVLDARGRRVRAEELGTVERGHHVWKWDGCDDRGRAVATGRYFLELRAGPNRARAALTLLR